MRTSSFSGTQLSSSLPLVHFLVYSNFIYSNINIWAGAARGVSGHTGGPYDTAPEVCILEALFTHDNGQYVPIHFDEAGTVEPFNNA